jgi:hypothetical protein
MDNPQVDRYIATLGARLRSLSPARRAEELREVRQHLDALVAGHLARGLSEEEAVEAALRQFGHAEQIGQQLQGALEQRRAPRLWPYLAVYLALVALIFGAFATANDQPTDFPQGFGSQLLLALALPAGTFAIHLVRYLRARRANRTA